MRRKTHTRLWLEPKDNGEFVIVPFRLRDTEELTGLLELAAVGIEHKDLPAQLHRMFPYAPIKNPR